MHDKIQRYSLRKLSVGLASVMVGACIFSANAETVKADVTSDQTTQVTKVQDQTVTAQAQSNDVQSEKKQTSSDQNSVVEPQKNLLDDLGKQKASTQSDDQAEAKNQENRLVDKINYKLTNNSSTDNKEDLGQNKVAPDETKSNPTAKSDVEKSIVSSSSTQQTNNRSNNHAEDNSQTQSEKLDLTKNSKKFTKKVLATNLIETKQSDDWADPAKQGFHYTTAGWTTEQQGKDYTDVAKKSHTILINQGTGKELDKNNSYEVGQCSGWGVDITATVDKSLIKQGNKILISNVALLSKDTTRMLQYTVQSANTMNIVSNGVKIGHIEAVSNYEPSSHRNMSYFLIVDQTQNMAKDLNLHFKINNSYVFNDQSAHFGYYKGTTPSNPAQFKLITNNSDLYNYNAWC